MKKFLKERSKILLVSTIICIILFILCIPELVNYSKTVNESIKLYNELMVNQTNFEADTLATTLSTGDYLIVMLFSDMLMSGFLMIASTFNIVGFVYKKLEFSLISIVLFAITLIANLHLIGIGGILVISAIIVLNIMEYISRFKANKKAKNK